MDTPSPYSASDYGGLQTSKWNFCYGYEDQICLSCGAELDGDGCGKEGCEDAETEWCFVATYEGEQVCRIPFSKLRVPKGIDRWNCQEVAMVGIGWVIEKFGINPNESIIESALDRSGFDLSICSQCGLPVICLPDGLPSCEPCATKANQ